MHPDVGGGKGINNISNNDDSFIQSKKKQEKPMEVLNMIIGFGFISVLLNFSLFKLLINKRINWMMNLSPYTICIRFH